MRILDMTAGNRAMWFDKKYFDCTFLDCRAEVHPDIVCDTREMPSSVGDGYSLVVFDPPHVNFGAKAEMSKTYGWHTTEEIRDIIKRSAEQAYKVTLPDALMAFKWNDHDQKLEKVLALMSEWWEPLFGQKTAQRTAHVCGTYWVMLRRRF